MRKGFTLVELLAVIVVLAIILAIAVPGISNIIKNSTISAFESDAKFIIRQIDYIRMADSEVSIEDINEDTITDYGISTSNYADLQVGLVSNEPYVIITGQGKWPNLKACGTKDSMVVLSKSDNNYCTSIPVDYMKNEGVNKPKLAPGMIPIKWENNSWITTTENDPEWYDYNVNKRWANAITRDCEIVNGVPTNIETCSMWVWIPRYAYQIATCYHMNGSDCETQTGKNAGTINVKFLKGSTNITNDNNTVDTIPTYVGNSQTNYIQHPGFTFDNTQLTGIWVAKFEPSVEGTTCYTDEEFSNEKSTNCNSTNLLPKFIPNKISWRYAQIGTQYTVGINLETKALYGWGESGSDIDTHMMKNIEWGAAAYLTQSEYGKNSEVALNDNTSYYTGGGTGDAYIPNINQSTTGNVYGIYDMAGCSYEYTMANYNKKEANSGLTPSGVADKYIDRYTSYSDAKYGDAKYETSFSVGTPNSWYGDYSQMMDDSYSWDLRGGDYYVGDYQGIFGFGRSGGGAGSDTTWRAVLLVETGL